jgi:hypothetical protein
MESALIRIGCPMTSTEMTAIVSEANPIATAAAGILVMETFL